MPSPQPLLEVEAARSRVLEKMRVLDPVAVPLDAAVGLVVARPVRAPHPMPRFDNSAMDGYAIRSDDVAGASRGSPVELTMLGEIRAGVRPEATLVPGGAMKIMTGAAVPEGADAVIEVEETSQTGDRIAFFTAALPGRNIRPAGDDFDEGAPLIDAGIEIGAGEAALLAAIGRTPVTVHPRPRVAVLITGDELVAPDTEPAPGQIRDSNSIALRCLVAEAGGEVAMLETVADTLDAHVDAFARAAAVADLVVSSGGVAVGDFDFVKEAVERLGGIDLWRVAMQPGKPVVLGHVHGTPFLGLPGNPVSVHVSFEQFVRPAVRKMRGCRSLLRPTLRAALAGDIEKRPGRLHFVRVRLSPAGAGWTATPTGAQGSHVQTSLVDCHGVARFPRDETRLSSGAEVTVEVWDLPGDE